MKHQTKQLVKNVAGFLAYHESAGIDSYPASEELGRLLARRGQKCIPQSVPPVASPRQRPAVRVEKPVQVGEVQTDGVSDPSSFGLKELGEEIAQCRACSLCQSRIMPVPGVGSEKCSLLIVGDWLSVDKAGQLPQNCQFGLDQDRMLNRMLEAIQVNRSEVFVTNVIKCGIPSSKQPQADHVNACLSFLQRQISTVRPRLILAMGLIASRTLLNRPESLSRLRGRLHSYQSCDKINIPLVATYHPTFLMQNEGMKKATWADLQLAAKHLAHLSGR